MTLERKIDGYHFKWDAPNEMVCVGEADKYWTTLRLRKGSDGKSWTASIHIVMENAHRVREGATFLRAGFASTSAKKALEGLQMSLHDWAADLMERLRNVKIEGT